ncbi:MAG: DUF3887 domain-containing protein [Armatimonadota bacterium]|nr:DUF3887 domain-containing protein [Armatimonadota bacterium]
MGKSTLTRGILLVGMLALTVIFMTSCAKSKSTPTPTITKIAESIVDSMAKGDFASVTTEFNATMKSQLPALELGEVWTQVTTQAGPFKARTGTREAQEQGYNVVYVTCQFEKSNIDIKVVFDNDKKVTGLFMVPSSAPVGR